MSSCSSRRVWKARDAPHCSTTCNNGLADSNKACAAAQDATRKQIGVGDIVDIAAGRVKGKSGTVKFIHRQGLFLHVRYLVS